MRTRRPITEKKRGKEEEKAMRRTCLASRT
ncbi:unnamed protein product [Spirodela intermedia]|uniref:Uncharacterized protein n=1 Tax=Spirodela intermedia TaxID=51605 RepID=A0A7I8J5J4_SPIIN|nr:unnamed protein product [Spirodela intermedia]CAA6665506.1 unnamed protein product [Spirodela intermedia]